MKFYTILFFKILFLVLFILGSVGFSVNKITLIQLLYLGLLLLNLYTIPFIFSNKKLMKKLIKTTNTSFLVLKVIFIPLYICLALLFDVFKSKFFINEVEYIPSTVFYLLLIIFVFDIVFQKKE